MPPVMVKVTFSRTISSPANGAMSTSTEAIMDRSFGVVLGLAYRTRVLNVGTTLIDRLEIFLSGRNRSLATRVAGMTRETLSADNRGLTPASAGSLLKDSSKLKPAGSRLERYSSSLICS
jgi:hypothetical protein